MVGMLLIVAATFTIITILLVMDRPQSSPPGVITPVVFTNGDAPRGLDIQNPGGGCVMVLAIIGTLAIFVGLAIGLGVL
jgi:hypothetical protein